MTFEKALEQIVKEGAIRLWRVSAGWAIAYRLQDGRWQARGLVRTADKWQAQQRMAGKSYRSVDGWYPVQLPHQATEPIALEAAEQNPGYFLGLTRQCGTCKLYKPLSEFKRQSAGNVHRSWECNQCAEERRQALRQYRRHDDQHVGDYVRRPAHTSRPPQEGEI
jgi:hypothetical protein